VSERSARGGAGSVLLFALLLGLLVWGAVVWASIHKTPGWEGWLTGIFGGGFAGLLMAAGGAWTAMLLFRPSRREAEIVDKVVVDDELGQVLAELEVARLRTKREIDAGSVWRIPLTVTAAIALWVATQFGDDPPDVFDLVLFIGGGAIAGYVWASSKLGGAYRRMYKERVLPRLAAGFGQLAWRPAQPPLDEFRRHRLFPDWDDVVAEDEIFGDYRGMPISIIELKLTKGSGDELQTIFRGLTAAVTLPRGLRGTTVVIPDRGMFGNLAERLRGGPCQPVRLEDPTFERAYEVYGSDQVSARALLTPAFMERFLALASSGRFGAPVALVQDNRLLMALGSIGGDLFEPPNYLKPAAGRDALSRLHDDIAAVLRAADAVIDLDQAARLQPRP
jgi:hypothetical protein